MPPWRQSDTASLHFIFSTFHHLLRLTKRTHTRQHPSCMKMQVRLTKIEVVHTLHFRGWYIVLLATLSTNFFKPFKWSFCSRGGGQTELSSMGPQLTAHCSLGPLPLPTCKPHRGLTSLLGATPDLGLCHSSSSTDVLENVGAQL